MAAAKILRCKAQHGDLEATAMGPNIWFFDNDTPGAPATGCFANIQSHTDIVNKVHITPSSTHIISCSNDCTARLHEISTGRQCGPPLMHPSHVMDLSTTNDGRIVVAGCRDGTVHSWDLARGGPFHKPVKAHCDRILCCAFTIDNGRYASTDGNDIAFFDTNTGQKMGDNFGIPGTALQFLPDRRSVAVGDAQGNIHLFDSTNRVIYGNSPIRAHNKRISAAAITIAPNGILMATADQTGTVKLWDARKFAPLAEWQAHPGVPVRSTGFSNDSANLVTASSDGTVRFWDTQTHEMLGKPINAHGGAVVRRAQLSGDGQTLVTCGEDKAIRLWDITFGKPTLTAVNVGGHIQHMSFVSGGTGIECDLLNGRKQVIPVPEDPSKKQDEMDLDGGGADILASVESGAFGAASAVDVGFGEREAAEVRGEKGGEPSSPTDPAASPACKECSKKDNQISELTRLQLKLKDELSQMRKSLQQAGIETRSFVIDRPYNINFSALGRHDPKTQGRFQRVPNSAELMKDAINLMKGRGKLTPTPQPVRGFQLMSVDAIVDADISSLESRISRLERLRERGGNLFNPASSQYDRDQLLTLMTLRDLLIPAPPSWGPYMPQMMHVFHGTKLDRLESVCDGIVAVRATDSGYFGSGVYTSGTIEYAAHYATGRMTNSRATPRSDGAFPVIWAVAALGNVFPVTRKDYDGSKGHHSKYFGGPLERGYDTHVTLVGPKNRYETTQPSDGECMEVVFDQETQVLPIAVMWVKPV